MGSLKENIKGIEWAKFIAIVESVSRSLGSFGNKYHKLPSHLHLVLKEVRYRYSTLSFAILTSAKAFLYEICALL